MPNIRWTLGVQVPGGPSAAKADQVSVDAYDKIEAVVPAASADLEVQVAPTNAELRLLMMAVRGLTDATDLTYKVNADDADEISADSPLLFLLGAGAIGLLAENSPRTLFFTNGSTTEDATVEILVGRDATP